jgi:hypothetical protein
MLPLFLPLTWLWNTRYALNSNDEWKQSSMLSSGFEVTYLSDSSDARNEWSWCIFASFDLLLLRKLEKVTTKRSEEGQRQSEREREMQSNTQREGNYHKLNAIKWIYILFAYITGRADTSSCSSLNDEKMQACYVHGARKKKRKNFWRWQLMRSNSNLNIYIDMHMYSLLISLDVGTEQHLVLVCYIE